ncbi:SDR family oxidoreductase [Novosphingobium sp. KCTC 2891]|uniref:SDR family oxidoreductase n=1 Tax=Novosphingobium sp. KCTC 2891 TaxID=2989730 RepID=UPI0022238F1F|nr:SDR family oxidoreductase [Novosphingobium sp. KCTC 2891]MCW1383649.1 SDR family oxidoreductase [Novosphingobium sp. KCTC 2891]
MADFSNTDFRLDGKVAIVTGAGGRGNSIGRAYAVALAQAGANVVVADLNGEGAQKVADEIVTLGGKAIAAQVDITDTASVAAMGQQAETAFGGVDILVNNAALMVEIVDKPLIETDRARFDKGMAVNVWGAINCAQTIAPLIAKRGGGAIVNQVSAGAFPAQSFYGVTKIALVGATTTLATELGRQGIRVNAIAPGMTKTDAGLSLTPDDSPLVQMAASRTPIQLRDTPDALCGALLLLVSEAGRWMTGQVLNVDGGWVMR